MTLLIATHSLLVLAGYSSSSVLTYSWTMQSASGAVSLDGFVSSPLLPYLYIPGGQLADQATYTFTCSVADAASGLSGQASTQASNGSCCWCCL